MNKDHQYEFDLFISYSRIPDGMLAKELERFLESFHKDLVLSNTEQNLRRLAICIDNSDFSIPPADGAQVLESSHRDVHSIVIRHLEKSRELLVLCSEQSAQSRWVIDEIQWFLENRGPGTIRIAFTQGEDPAGNMQRYLADNLLRHGLDKNLAYDFRGYDERKTRHWLKVEGFKQETVRLAAHLYGLTPGELYPSWLESELQRAREQSLRMSTNARLESLIGDPAHAVLAAHNAHQIHPNNESEIALREAYKVAIYHHYNRRESSHISGAGPGYLAGRWKQGGVFVKNSVDGRYQLFVTERGKDGAPVGDIYLLGNETMRAVKLETKKHSGARVEEVAFSRDSRNVFVTRYFNLQVYALDGQIIGSYYFGRHTKSPVHIVAGYLNNRFLLAGETKGGLWLVDPFVDYLEQKNVTRQVYREFHGDATIHIDISRDGNAALLVFESGKAQLLVLDESDAFKLLEILPSGVQYAGFFADQRDRLITSGKDGIVRLWRINSDGIAEQSTFEALDTAIDWVTISEDRMQLAAVGANQTIHILDMETHACLRSLDYTDDIDWGAVRSVKIPEYEFVLAFIEAQASESFDEGARKATDYIILDDEKWFITSEQSNEYFPTVKAWRVEDDQARLYDTNSMSITRHQDLLWLHYRFSDNGAVFWKVGDKLKRFPAEGVRVNTILENDNGCWLGTSNGAYYHHQDEHRLLTPLDIDIKVIKKFGDKLYAGSKEDGAYLIEDNRTVLITPSFLRIKDIKEIAGNIWLLTNLETSGFLGNNGPAYKVEGYFARPFPDESAEVSDVIEENGKVSFVSKGPWDDLDFSNLNLDFANLDPGQLNEAPDESISDENNK